MHGLMHTIHTTYMHIHTIHIIHTHVYTYIHIHAMTWALQIHTQTYKYMHIHAVQTRVQKVQCACMLYVLYASAQASADAITTGLAYPRGRRQPAGPTQDSPGQQPRHFIPRSGTHSHTRFGAPVRAARVGGAKAAHLHSPWALQLQWALDDPILSPVRADLGRWRCA